MMEIAELCVMYADLSLCQIERLTGIGKRIDQRVKRRQEESSPLSPMLKGVYLHERSTRFAR